MSDETPKKIFPAIVAIMRAIKPIAKDRRNEQQKYNFRGIDDVYNACFPHFAANGVFSTSEVLDKQCTTEKVAQERGGEKVINRSILTMRYTFHAEDGSSVSTEVVGEGLDYGGDKASNKAMSAADKYAILQLLKIPTAMVDSDRDDRRPPERNGSAPTATPRGQRGVNPQQLTELKEEFKQCRPGASGADWQSFVALTTGRTFAVTQASNWTSEEFEKVKGKIHDPQFV